MRKMKQASHSKSIVDRSWRAAICLTLVVIVGSLFSLPVSDIATITTLAWGEVAVANGFYYWKARSENRSKYAMQLVRDLADTYGIDAVVGLAGIVLQE